MKFWTKEMWPPYNPDANPLDYAFWPHVEAEACTIRHANIADLKASLEAAWNSMPEAYIKKTCQAFRKRLGKIVAAKGGYIE